MPLILEVWWQVSLILYRDILGQPVTWLLTQRFALEHRTWRFLSRTTHHHSVNRQFIDYSWEIWWTVKRLRRMFFMFAIIANLMILLEMGKTFDLSKRNLTSMPNTSVIPTSITSLYLTSNSVPRINAEDLAPFIHLQGLFIQSNGMRFIEDGSFDNNAKLQNLDLSYNRIYHLPSSFGPPKLYLRRVQFWHALTKNVENLDFGNPVQFPALEEYNIGLCYIDNLELSKLPVSVSKLVLNFNPLAYFPDFASYAPNIVTLLVANTEISYIPAARIKSLTKVRMVSIARNRLKSIPDMYDMSLTILDIGNNPLECNHSLCWVRMWNEKKPTPLSMDSAKCASPTTLSGKKLRDVHPVELQCYQGELTTFDG